MSLHQLRLPDLLISELYKKHLISIDTEAPVGVNNKPERAPAFSFLGNHLKHVAVFVHAPGSTHLADSDLHFLANILKACQLNLADIAIINLAKQQVTYSDLQE